MINQSELIQFALTLADCANAISRHYFTQPLNVEHKEDNSPVSQADREIEQSLRQQINQRYPDHGIFAEEFENLAVDSDYLWVIDPIDGTKSFIARIPLFGTLISLVYKDNPILGIIDIPILKQRWIGAQNKNALMNNQTVQSRSNVILENCVIVSTGIDYFNNHELSQFHYLSKYCQYRIFGGDCYNYGLLASGSIDIVMESGLKPYDYFALIPIIKGSGGVISDWQGNPLTIESNGQVLACANQSLHDQCLEKINNAN